jgi:hypothetical protein
MVSKAIGMVNCRKADQEKTSKRCLIPDGIGKIRMSAGIGSQFRDGLADNTGLPIGHCA